MKSSTTTNWNSLLGTKKDVCTLKSFAAGDATTKEATTRFANTPKAGEFRKLVRTYGTTYARRLTRKALSYRGLLTQQS
jgi:hypothetical protein